MIFRHVDNVGQGKLGTGHSLHITCKIKKLTLNEKSILKMYNSVIECVKVSNMFIGLKKDLFGLV